MVSNTADDIALTPDDRNPDDEIIVACEMLEDELKAAMASTGIERDILWTEAGLHDLPKKLHVKLQEVLDGIEGRKRALLVFTNCGNAAQELNTGDFEMIIPRLDDCASLLIGSQEKRIELSREFTAIYLTDGFMRAEQNIQAQYDRTVEKYGKETADGIFDMMYEHYDTLGLLDSGVCPIEKLFADTKGISDLLGLTQRAIPATISYIEQLLTGPWPEEKFVHVAPHSTLEAREFLPY